MATERWVEGRSGGAAGEPGAGKGSTFSRHEDAQTRAGRRAGPELTGVHAELDSARSLAAALLTQPRARCRVSQVQTTRWGVIEAVDEVLGLMLQRPAKGLVGLALSSLIAGPERRVFGERARMIIEGRDGAEWETRVIAPGARIGVPVAMSVERGAEGAVRWYIRDLTELRRVQARVMELEQLVRTS